jgi:hypothetical protein
MRLVSRQYHLMTETFTLQYRRTRQRGEAAYTPAATMRWKRCTSTTKRWRSPITTRRS